MDYRDELARVQQDLARSHDMDRRRTDVLAALAPAPGDRIIEIGCGGGLLLREISRAVVPGGSVLGIDVSGDQVTAARATCADLDHVALEVQSATALESDDASFDASVSTQVLEYIDDVDTAIAELARVTGAGGRFVNVATNWDTLFIAGGDPRATDAIVDAWDRHAPYPNLPVSLPGRLERAGFGAVRQEPLPLANRVFNPSTFGYGITRLMAAFAVQTGTVDAEASRAWLDGLAASAAAGEFFISVMPMLTVASRR